MDLVVVQKIGSQLENLLKHHTVAKFDLVTWTLNSHAKPNFIFAGKRRTSKYDGEFSDGQLGINEKELNSMNKHIPGK